MYEQLPYALWAYQTSIITGATNFSLVYGDEAIVRLELEIPNLRISLQQLKSLDEKRIKAIEHHKGYHAKLKRSFSKKIKVKEFKVDDLVLKENINKTIANNKFKGKFESNWLGPFFVVEAKGSRAYRLSSINGKVEPKNLNSTHLKHFFA